MRTYKFIVQNCTEAALPTFNLPCNVTVRQSCADDVCELNVDIPATVDVDEVLESISKALSNANLPFVPGVVVRERKLPPTDFYSSGPNGLKKH